MIFDPTRLDVRRGHDRGTTELPWLHSRHSFSFGRSIDRSRLNFRSLRVLNDDVIAPGGGFGEHGHDNMEIISWMLSGAIAHADSTGTRGVIRPGDVQVMSAGRGIRHSEINASKTEPAHLIQIWIEPAQRDLPPAYQQRPFAEEGRRNRWQVVASPDEREESLGIHQDASLSIADLDCGAKIQVNVETGRHAYLHLALGRARIGAMELSAGDAVTVQGPARLEIEGIDRSQAVLFDIA